MLHKMHRQMFMETNQFFVKAFFHGLQKKRNYKNNY